MLSNVQPVMFRGRLAAVAGEGCFYLAPHLEALEDDHPERIFVSVMCFYARDVLTGRAPQPYRDDLAEMATRSALIDDRGFASAASFSDSDLAEMFTVPLDQVAAKRVDLARPERLRPAGLA